MLDQIRMCLNYTSVPISDLWYGNYWDFFLQTLLSWTWVAKLCWSLGHVTSLFSSLGICGFLRSQEQLEWEEWGLLVGCLFYFVMWILVTSIWNFVGLFFPVCTEWSLKMPNLTEATLSVWKSTDKQINRIESAAFWASLTSGFEVSRQHTELGSCPAECASRVGWHQALFPLFGHVPKRLLTASKCIVL